MQIKIDYEELDIPDFEGILVDKKNYNLRQSKKFIKKLLTYDYNYLKEANFNEETYLTTILIICINKYNKYKFISNLESRKLTKMRYIENGK